MASKPAVSEAALSHKWVTLFLFLSIMSPKCCCNVGLLFVLQGFILKKNMNLGEDLFLADTQY